MIARATGVAGLSPRIERINAFSFAAQIAERFRLDDVFLVATRPIGSHREERRE